MGRGKAMNLSEELWCKNITPQRKTKSNMKFDCAHLSVLHQPQFINVDWQANFHVKKPSEYHGKALDAETL